MLHLHTINHIVMHCMYICIVHTYFEIVYFIFPIFDFVLSDMSGTLNSDNFFCSKGIIKLDTV